MKKPRKKKLLKLIEKSGGIILPISQALDVSRKTVYNWINSDPELQEALDDAREGTLDIVESKYFKAAMNGSERAQEFLLKNLGKKRGYEDSSKIIANVESTGNMTILPKLTPEDIEELKRINGLI